MKKTEFVRMRTRNSMLNHNGEDLQAQTSSQLSAATVTPINQNGNHAKREFQEAINMEVECKFQNIIMDCIYPERTYTCTVDSCNIKSRGTKITAFEGVHKPTRDNTAVKALRFIDCTVNFVPKNLTQIFPNLEFLEIRDCALKEVSADDMIGLEQLDELSLINNDLTTLPIDLFRNMPNLREVYLSRNRIHKFDPEILNPIKDTLEAFEILHNPGISTGCLVTVISIEDFIKQLKMLEAKEQDPKKFQMRFEELFTTGKHSDFTITSRDKKYKVHKCILASQSLVFDKMFEVNPGVPVTELDINRIYIPEAVEEFIRHFYTKADPSRDNAVEMFSLAVEFDVPDLKMQCEAILSRSIGSENACGILNLAHVHSLENLQRTAFKVIQQCHPEIADYLFEKPELVNAIVEAKGEFQAKKLRLENSE